MNSIVETYMYKLSYSRPYHLHLMAFHFMILLLSTTVLMPIATSTATQGKVLKPATRPSTKTKRSAKPSAGSVRSPVECSLEEIADVFSGSKAVWHLVPTIVFVVIEVLIVVVVIWISRASKV